MSVTISTVMTIEVKTQAKTGLLTIYGMSAIVQAVARNTVRVEQYKT